MKKPWVIIWAIVALVVVVLESVALALPGTGDTLSSQVWGLLDTWPFLAPLGVGFMVWLTVHFFGPRDR